MAEYIDGILEQDDQQAQEWHGSDAERDLVEALQQRIEEAEQHKRPINENFELAERWIRGDQVTLRHRVTQELISVNPKSSLRLHSIRNKLITTKRALEGKLLRNMPTCMYRPATEDYTEIHGAQATNAILQYVRYAAKVDVAYMEAMDYLAGLGNAIMFVFWDPKGGQEIALCPVCDFTEDAEMIDEECPNCQMQRQNELEVQQQQFADMQQEQQESMMGMGGLGGEMGMMEMMDGGMAMEPPEPLEPPELIRSGPLEVDQEVPLMESSYSGEVCCEAKDPKTFYGEPGVSKARDLNWFYFKEVIPLHEAKADYPKFAKYFEADTALYTDRPASVASSNLDLEVESYNLQNHVEKFTFVERPTSKYPDGRVITMVNEIIVDTNEEPNFRQAKRLPCFHFKFFTDGERFYGTGFVSHAIGPQYELNRSESIIRESHELHVKQKLLVPLGAKITERDLSSRAKTFIEYNAAMGRPIPLEYPRLPQQIYEREAALKGDILGLAGVAEHEASPDTVDRAGRTLALLEAAANQQIQPIVMRNNEEFKELHKFMILLAKKMYPEDKIASIPGDEAADTFSFGDMRLEPNGWDLVIEMEDGFSKNPALRKQEALEQLNTGVVFMKMDGSFDKNAYLKAAGIQLNSIGPDVEKGEYARARRRLRMIEDQVGDPQSRAPKAEDNPEKFYEIMLWALRVKGEKGEYAPDVEQEVRWNMQFYQMWATGGPPPTAPQPGTGQEQQQGGPEQNQPGSGPGGPNMTAQGGTPNSPGGVAHEAQGMVRSADRSAENQARIQQQHEG